MKKYKKIAIIIGVILLLIAAYVKLDFLHSKDALNEFISASENNGNIMFITIFILVGILVTTLCIPVSWMRIIGAIKLGFSRAVIANFLVENISALILFSFVRWMGREKANTYIKKWAIKKNIDLNKFQHKLDKHGIMYVVLLRNIPILPFFTCNIFLALSSMSYRKYIEGNVLGTILGIVINVFMYCKFVQYQGQMSIEIILAIILILYYIGIAYIGKKTIDTMRR